MKLKGKKIFGPVLLLITLVITLGVVGSCTGGIMPVGWSGGIVSGNYIFVGNNAGQLVSLNLTDSSILPSPPLQPQSTGGLLSCACGQGNTAVPIYGTPAVSDNAVFVAGYNGQLVSFRSDNMAKRWTYPQSGYKQAFVGGAVFYNDVVYIGCSDSFVYAIDSTNGAEIAKFETGDKIWGTPAIDPDTNTLYIGSYDKSLYALSLDNLTLKWSYATEGSIISTPLVADGTVYFGSFDRHLYALNASDGTLKWNFRGSNWFWAQPLIYENSLYASDLEGFAYVIDPANGNSLHEPYNLQAGIASPPAVVDNLLVFINRKGVVYKLDTATMQMAQVYDYGLAVDGPIMAHDGIVYIHPQTNFLLRVNPVNGATLPAIELK